VGAVLLIKKVLVVLAAIGVVVVRRHRLVARQPVEAEAEAE